MSRASRAHATRHVCELKHGPASLHIFIVLEPVAATTDGHKLTRLIEKQGTEWQSVAQFRSLAAVAHLELVAMKVKYFYFCRIAS